MFERYTEKARRVIFFARYEASQYGSPVIDTEHILLGLLGEDRPLMRQLHLDFAPQIRDEIAKVVRQGERISTSVEMPLSADSQEILQLASEEADRLANQRVGTEHILLAILRVEKSLAATLLTATAPNPDPIPDQTPTCAPSAAQNPLSPVARPHPAKGALVTLD